MADRLLIVVLGIVLALAACAAWRYWQRRRLRIMTRMRRRCLLRRPCPHQIMHHLVHPQPVAHPNLNQSNVALHGCNAFRRIHRHFTSTAQSQTTHCRNGGYVGIA